MQSAIILGVAALASTAHASLGYGTIVNACSYAVSLCNVPSDDGVHEQYETTLQPGAKYSQQWTSLLNNNGWSMKLNPDGNTTSIMQFEYTWSEKAPDDLWFDMSYVDGNPWLGDWYIESSDPETCVVKQTAYAYSTDDANGMQPMCNPDTSVTITLCRNTAGSYDNGAGSVDGGASSSSSSSSVNIIASVSNIVQSILPVYTSTPSTTSTSTSSASPVIATKAADSPILKATTFATSTSSSAKIVPTTIAVTSTEEYHSGGVTITQIDTAVVTAYVTATAWDGHGHGHWARHAHAHNHQN